MTNREFIERIALEGEEWRIIDGTLGYFAVSDYGRVSSLSHRVSGGNNNSWMTKPRILTPRPNRGGYLRVRLTSLHGVDKTELVHRLVAKAFIPNPNNYAYVDHIDGNRTNNVAHNLRWCTRSMNMLNPVTRECAAKARRIPNKRNRKPIVQIKNGILVAEDIAQVGDTLKIEGRAFDGRTFDVEAVVVGTYNRSDLMEDSPVVPGSPYFIMTYDTAKKLTGITEQTGILAVKNSEGRFDEVLAAVQKIADKNGKIEVNTIEQTIKNIQYRYSASIHALYMTSAILFVFGSISLMNMLMVDFQNRKREFGLLEAVGTTRQQLKAMLDREMGIYLGGSLVIALVFGSILSVIVCRRLDAVNHCITLVLPWLFLLALVVVLAVIYLIFTVYAKSELKKTSILSAIREE